MNLATIQNFKTLFLINRLGAKRESGKDIKKITLFIRALSLLLVFASIIMMAVAIVKGIKLGEINLFEAAKYSAIAFGPLLGYDLLIRASLPSGFTEELPAVYTLPIKKKDVILYKLLYNSTGPLVFMWVALYIPIFGVLGYFNAGIPGIIHSFLFLTIAFTINKLVVFLMRYYFSAKKVLTITCVLLFYAIVSLPAILYKLPIIADVYGKVLLPENGYWLTYLILVALLLILERITYHALRTYKIDNWSNNASDNSFQFNSLSKSDKWSKMGALGEQIKVDLLFIFRNKKLRPIVFMVVFFVVFSCVSVYKVTPDQENWASKLIFPFIYSALLSYISLIQYGAMNMELYYTKKNQIINMLKSKYIIVITLVFLQLVLTAIFTLFRGLELLPLIALYSFTPGVISLFGLSAYIFNSVGNDPDAKTIVNKSFSGLVFIILVGGMLIIPLIGVTVGLLFDEESTQNIFVIALNASIALISPLWIKGIAKQMGKRKYKNLDGIRNSLN